MRIYIVKVTPTDFVFCREVILLSIVLHLFETFYFNVIRHIHVSEMFVDFLTLYSKFVRDI